MNDEVMLWLDRGKHIWQLLIVLWLLQKFGVALYLNNVSSSDTKYIIKDHIYVEAALNFNKDDGWDKKPTTTKTSNLT